jgi:hypothetical protein
LYLAIIVPMTSSLGVLGAALSLTISFILGVVLQALETHRLLGSSSHATFVALGRTGIIGLIAGVLLSSIQGEHQVAIPWTPEILALLAAGMLGGYLWWIERPRLNALWNYQAQGARA